MSSKSKSKKISITLSLKVKKISYSADAKGVELNLLCKTVQNN